MKLTKSSSWASSAGLFIFRMAITLGARTAFCRRSRSGRTMSGEAFTSQLRSIATGPAEVEIVRTIATATGFLTEHVETQHDPEGDLVARRLHVCDVTDGVITAVTTYCNGGWDAELRARHAADAPMVRP